MQAIGKPLILKDGTRVPLSPAIRAGNFLFLSGQLGLLPDMTLAGDDVASQTAQALANIETVLAEAGVGLDRIVKTTVWLTEARDFAAFNAVYGAVFSQVPPARSTVVSELLISGARVEIEVIACLSDG